jgi:hypothetical protein
MLDIDTITYILQADLITCYNIATPLIAIFEDDVNLEMVIDCSTMI